MNFFATYLGSSGWLIELGTLRILIDPWLRGKLFFAPGKWLIEGTLNEELVIPQNLDLLVLTQGLPDHAHPQTLTLLPKSLNVVASPSAAKVVRDLGFENINSLLPGESFHIEDLSIQATAGAPVPTVENGYILRHPCGSFYIEPHGYLDPSISSQPLDAVITPVVDLKLPIFGSFIRGKSILNDLIERFKPLSVFASTTGGESTFTGVINHLISIEGSIDEARNLVEGSTKFIDPYPGKKYDVLRNITIRK